MSILLSILGSIFAIVIIIVLHEGGHFAMARLLGVRVLRFSIGFGRPICRYVSKRSGTEYVVGILPLGGYVRMHGDESDERAVQDADAFCVQALWKRFLIVIAGPLVNFILALVIIWGLLLSGIHYIAPVVGQVVPSSSAAEAGLKTGDLILSVNHQPTKNWQAVMMEIMEGVGEHRALSMVVQPDFAKPAVHKLLPIWTLNFNKKVMTPLNDLGFSPYYPPMPAVVERVLAGSPAFEAGVLPGDHILMVNGKAVSGWVMFTQEVRDNPGAAMRWEVINKGVKRTLTVKAEARAHDDKAYGYVGVAAAPAQWPAQMQRVERYGVFSGWVPAWHHVWGMLSFKVGILMKLVVGDLPMKVLGGPISIFQSAGQATLAGWQVYWQFVAIISLSIGFINLLPIPGLDGGHVLFQLCELIKRKPLSFKAQRIAIASGVILLLFFMVQVTFYDLGRLFNF